MSKQGRKAGYEDWKKQRAKGKRNTRGNYLKTLNKGARK